MHALRIFMAGAMIICAPLFSGNKVVGVHEASNAAGKIGYQIECPLSELQKVVPVKTADIIVK